MAVNRAIEYSGSALRDLHLQVASVMATILEMMATFRDERARSSPDDSTLLPCIDPTRFSGPGLFGSINSEN